MKNVGKSEVLVLNRNWNPINVRSLEKAIKAVVSGKAKIIDTNNPNFPLYDWDEWCELEVDRTEEVINSVKKQIKLPKIIVLTKCSKIYNREVKLTRKNVFSRDKYLCVYCGRKVTNLSGTIDHIIPKSRGGKNIWENVVTACFNCNMKKKDKLLNECGMKLPYKPIKPSWHPLSTKISSKSDSSWKQFLPNNVLILGDHR